MNTISEQELEVTRSIIDVGLKKAAESMSFFMNEKIQIQQIDCKISLANNELNLSIDEKNNYLLTTEIIGELKGVCYLIFSESEIHDLTKVALPAEIRNDPAKLPAMQEAILLEVDNIISASVITQFSNLFKYKMFGGVPKLRVLSGVELQNTIHESMVPDKLLMGFKTVFTSSKSDFTPEFFWVFDPHFFDGVKKYIQETQMKTA